MSKVFTVVNSATQSTISYESQAETLGQLKRELADKGINLDGMTIFEGLTKTELKSDDSLLPHDVPYRGTITNNLVFRITKANKNIKSGSMSRAEAYAKIKELNLQGVIASKYGKNFTMCKTADLINEINKVETHWENPTTENNENTSSDATVTALEEKFDMLIKVLLDNDVIDDVDVDIINSKPTVQKKDSEEKSPYSNDEISDMFNF
jgi:hypothetical protein